MARQTPSAGRMLQKGELTGTAFQQLSFHQLGNMTCLVKGCSLHTVVSVQEGNVSLQT